MMEDARRLQERTISALLTLVRSGKKEVTLKAPTGSGKTRMMAGLMSALLKEDEGLVFLVSTLSKGSLARQNFEAFEDLQEIFGNLRPFYISTDEKKSEGGLELGTGFNVYVLPSAQYTKNSRIFKEKALQKFFLWCQESGKRVILLRDESHIATNKLEELEEFFSQKINFSATPKNDAFDLCLKESEAVETGLIRGVEFVEEQRGLEEDLGEVLREFKALKKAYEGANLGINPALIVQVSNDKKGSEECGKIKQMVGERGLLWVSFVADRESGYETNTALKRMKNRALWHSYVKRPDSPVDVVFFKMVITEGFDMPRACMLYQVRDSKSTQLDEQVVGRVRRNPCLAFFENLGPKTRELVMRAKVWGMRPKEDKKRVRVRLRGEVVHNEGGLFYNEIMKEFKPFIITKLKEAPLGDIDLGEFLKQGVEERESIFTYHKRLQKAGDSVNEKLKESVKSFGEWFCFVANLERIKKKIQGVESDYESYGDTEELETFREELVGFFDEEGYGASAKNWIWAREDNGDNFSFDSEAEGRWFGVLEGLKKCCKNLELNGSLVYLFGKNFPDRSNVKYAYYLDGRRVSYPDFILKDKWGRVHIFEVKSKNKSKKFSGDETQYNEKIRALKEGYRYASKKISYIFYIAVLVGEDWNIFRYKGGQEKTMNKGEFEEWMEGEGL